MKNFIQELEWRGMIQDCMPETEQHLLEGVLALVFTGGGNYAFSKQNKWD